MILEVVEEPIPAHPARVGQPGNRVRIVIHRGKMNSSCEFRSCSTTFLVVPPDEVGTMATMPAGAPRRPAPDAYELSQFFAPQRTASSALPDPEIFLRNLTRGVFEVLAGVREVEQLARWVTEDAFRKLVVRSNLAARARSARGQAGTPAGALDPVRALLRARRRRGGGCARRDRSGTHPSGRGAPRGHGRPLARDVARPALTPDRRRADPSVVAARTSPSRLVRSPCRRR